MPGLIAFRRRWSVGSDDLAVPGTFLFLTHLIWVVVITVVLSTYPPVTSECGTLLWQHLTGYLGLLVVSMVLELLITVTSLRGSILDTDKRKSITNLIYLRLVVLFLELSWLVLGLVWLSSYYPTCTEVSAAKGVLLGLVICNLVVILSIVVTVWCTYDPAGRSWVKMMNYQRSMKQSESRFQYRRSGSCTRTWRQRKVLRAYQDSWDHRCRLLFCCMRHSDRSKNSFSDIARLLSDFFRDIDVVPSDVVAGLVLLRKYQKIERESILNRRLNDTYEYLSGVAVTSKTQFLALNDPAHYNFFQDVIYYMHFAIGAYGWPFYVMNHAPASIFELCTSLRCNCMSCCRPVKENHATIIKDNCCMCNYTALQQIIENNDVEIVYATFHVDVGITPFFVSVDYERKKIIISIRGTLSLQDVLTDLNAEGEPLPITPPKEDWLGHKGMVQVAVHILDKLMRDNILNQAFRWNVDRGTESFQIVTVGHSLGAGAAAILAILLRDTYPDVLCYSYSPPGGTLSMPAAEYTKRFITSVVVGKDVVPRIGLHQMESLRADLMHAIKRSKDPKWKTISCSVVCCGCAVLPTSAAELQKDDMRQFEYQQDKHKAREVFRAQSSNVALTSHQPLFPPGRIIHVVRHHSTRDEQVINKRTPVYQALWANNTDFDEVLISPVMIQDHMPDQVLAALEKVVECHQNQLAEKSTRSAVTAVNVATTSPLHGSKSSGANFGPMHDVIEFQTRFLHSTGVADADTVPAPADTNHHYFNMFKVITTAGPRKPQRRSSVHQQTCSPLISPSVTNTPPHKILLETSFTSLISPGEKQTSLQSFNSTTSVTTPTLFQTEIKRHVPWEFSSLRYETKHPVDLIHDDWLGLAPLATPESLSEVSSISSRSFPKTTPPIVRTIRRTPKISNGLSTADEDAEKLRDFELMMKCDSGDTFVSAKSHHDVFHDALDTINHHKPTTIVDIHEKPYLETDFSLSDPNIPKGLSFDQDYEFDTESLKLISTTSKHPSECSIARSKKLLPQDSCYPDDDEESNSRREELPLLAGLNSEVIVVKGESSV